MANLVLIAFRAFRHRGYAVPLSQAALIGAFCSQAEGAAKLRSVWQIMIKQLTNVKDHRVHTIIASTYLFFWGFVNLKKS